MKTIIHRLYFHNHENIYVTGLKITNLHLSLTKNPELRTQLHKTVLGQELHEKIHNDWLWKLSVWEDIIRIAPQSPN